jgi:hypothetical protein
MGRGERERGNLNKKHPFFGDGETTSDFASTYYFSDKHKVTFSNNKNARFQLSNCEGREREGGGRGVDITEREREKSGGEKK